MRKWVQSARKFPISNWASSFRQAVLSVPLITANLKLIECSGGPNSLFNADVLNT